VLIALPHIHLALPKPLSDTRQGRRFSLFESFLIYTAVQPHNRAVVNRVTLFVTVGTGRFITLTYFVTGGFILATLFTQLSIYSLVALSKPSFFNVLISTMTSY